MGIGANDASLIQTGPVLGAIIIWQPDALAARVSASSMENQYERGRADRARLPGLIDDAP